MTGHEDTWGSAGRRLFVAIASLVVTMACGSESSEGAAGDEGRDGGSAEDRAEAGACRSITEFEAPPASAPDVRAAEPRYVHRDPTGPYAVGTHYMYLEDASRPEPVTEDPDDHRLLRVQIFYPTDADTGPFGPLMDDESAWAVTGNFTMARFHEEVETRSRFDVPLAREGSPFPVLVYSHGLTGFLAENQELLEEFASRGWVVVSVGHTYSSAATLLPDGTLAGIEHDLPPPPTAYSVEWEQENYEAMFRLLTETWAADISFVFDALERIQSGERCEWLSGHLDVNRMGMLGYSFGGATAFQVCATDDRCQAALDIDGRFHGEVPIATDTPMMWIRSTGGDTYAWDTLRDVHGGTTYTLFIDDADHGDFYTAQLAQQSLFPLSGGPSLAHLQRVLEATRTGAVAFMERHVLDLDAPVLDAPAPAPAPGIRIERAERGRVAESLVVFGTARSVYTDVPLTPPVEVTLNDAQSVTADADGFFAFEGVAPDRELLVTASAPDALSGVVLVPARARYALVGGRPFPEAELARRVDAVGAILDPALGHVAFAVELGYRKKRVAPLSGATVERGEGFVHYVDETGAFDLTLAETSIAGSGMMLNVTPGRHALTVSAPGRQCHDVRDSGSPANVVTAEVRPGGVSTVVVRCESE